MRLSELKINESCFVLSVNKNYELCDRLKELGFVKGQRVKCSDVSLFGSPVSYKLCGTKIALRNKSAHNIEVKLSEN